ncbi:MAG: hypothetical protein KF689_10465 [Gemmatimonadaceae bacterium]|nr:hypothetical protein [Gemmatimonadaceae bacterium]MCW5825979.1 hypothetical protein [Gemmatimonadaceae bacterium]
MGTAQSSARLAATRKGRGLSQEALAAEVGVSRPVTEYDEGRDARADGSLRVRRGVS